MQGECVGGIPTDLQWTADTSFMDMGGHTSSLNSGETVYCPLRHLLIFSSVSAHDLIKGENFSLSLCIMWLITQMNISEVKVFFFLSGRNMGCGEGLGLALIMEYTALPPFLHCCTFSPGQWSLGKAIKLGKNPQSFSTSPAHPVLCSPWHCLECHWKLL